MHAREKASELIVTYQLQCNSLDYQQAKQCALIAVEEILSNNCGTNTDGQQAYENEIYCDEYFWHDVKSELQSF
jgi:hypothetical protein